MYFKFNAMHKLGSSPIGCEFLSIPGGITNGVLVWGRPLSVMKVLCNLRKAKAKQDKTSITMILSVTQYIIYICIYVYIIYIYDTTRFHQFLIKPIKMQIGKLLRQLLQQLVGHLAQLGVRRHAWTLHMEPEKGP